MILEANPSLTARDLRRIVGLTAFKTDPQQAKLPWFMNGAGKYSHFFVEANNTRSLGQLQLWVWSD